MNLLNVIRVIPDYPKPGILFRDITTLLGDAEAFKYAVEALAAPFVGKGVDKVASCEARGFIVGAPVAHHLGAGFVPLRKKGKLPHHTYSAQYELEYGIDALEMHTDAIKPGERVLLVDDLIATGGTAMASIELLRQGGAQIVGAAFVIDLPDLGGAARVAAVGVAVNALLKL